MTNFVTADAPSACSWHSRAIRRASVIALATLMLLAAAAHAQTLTVYDDALQNGFSDWSYNGNVDLASTAVVYSGTKSIAFTGNASFNAVSLEHAAAFSTATYPVLHFYVNGGAAGGQHVHLNLYDTDSHVAANASIDSYISGGGIAANTWREVTVNLTQAPLSYNGNYVRFDLQTETGVQPVVYFDDITLTQASAPAVSPLQIQHDVSVAADGMIADRLIWQDSAGHPRSVALAHNIAPADPAGPNGSRGGALHEYTYQLTTGATRTATVTTFGNGGYGGFGYVVSHSHYYGSHPCVTNDDSPLGYVFGGTWQRVFEGRHHAIFRFTQSYPRNCDGTNTPVQRFVPVTIDWVFSTGRDNPLWAVTYDVDQIAAPGGQPAPANTYFDDSRAPYGELNIDGDGWTDLNGVAWGDFYKFTTTNAAGTGVTQGSPWNWTATNTVPYVQTWLDGPLSGTSTLDAAMGIVQTQTIAQQDAGGARDQSIGSDITPEWQHTSLTAGTNFFPNGDNWPYQTIGDNVGCNCGLNDARMTWKTQWGFIGQTTYLINNGAAGASAATAPGYPKKSYSTYIVLGQRTTAPVEAQVTQVETVQSLVLTINGGIGSVVTSGPAGITRADNVTYSPAGYNHVYGALAFTAASNHLTANIAVGSGTLKKPMIIVGNYTAGDPQVTLGGALLVADADYFASLRPAANELWITLNTNLNGATNQLDILGTGGTPATPTGVVAAALTSNRIDVAWNAVGGAGSYQVDRRQPGGGFVQIGTSAGNSFPDTTVTPNTAYLYRVRAVNGANVSANSAPDLATAIIFTDAPPLAGKAVKAVDLSELRTAVNAVRSLAGLGAPLAFTGAATPGATISAVHVTELRTALDQARLALTLSTGGYTDAAPLTGVTIKAVHFQELRDRVQ